MLNTKEEKKKLRKELMQLRDSIPEEERLNSSELIFAKVRGLECYKNAKTVMIYVSFGTELDTHKFIQDAIADGKKVITPICGAEHTMILAVTTEFPKGFITTKMGILELPADNVDSVEPEELDIIITPGISFTLDGKRLGYGGGYYDRLFMKTRADALKLCPCYEKLITEDLPWGAYDKKIDMVVTERQICVMKN